MNNSSSGLRITAHPIRNSSQFQNVLDGIPISLILLLGSAVSICNHFPSVHMPWWGVFAIMFAFSALLWILQLTEKGRWISFSFLVLIPLISIIFHRQVLEGIGCLANDLMNQLTRITGRIYPDLALSQETSILWGVVPIIAIISVLLHLSIQTGRALFFLPVLLPVYISTLTGFSSIGVDTFLIFLGGIFLIIRRAGAAHDQEYRGTLSQLFILILCAFLAIAIGFFYGDTRAKTEKWDRTLHSILFDQDSNSMPEGRLRNLKKWRRNDTQALKITMSKPQKLYLRGQIFETYSGIAWSPLSAQIRAEYEDLFYQLHQSGFFGQSQIATASTFLTHAAPEELTIENLSACSAHGYYPYAVSGNDMLDAWLIGDALLPVADTMKYYPGSVPEWYSVQHSLASGQKRSNISQYLLAEQAYEEYVTEVDLQLTNESWSVLNRQLGEDQSPKTLSQIREFIRLYLSEALVYDEDVATLNGNGDFLQYTLEKSGSGYSVHYATAATLMLRYFGVPARYVEGYFLPEAEAAVYQPGEEIFLSEHHAHAWAEYYLPGVGFIPFEVTPGYIDDEELELGNVLSQDQQTYSADHLKYAQVEQPESIKEPKQDRFSFSMKPIYLLYISIALLLLLALMIIIKRKKLKNALAAISMAPHRDAIAMRFGYALRLLECCENAQIDENRRAEELNREALFSDHEMTAQQRREMDEYADCVLGECRDKWTFFDKLRYRLWDCLY